MRILIATKRQYTGRDLLDDCYGRLFEIPKALAEQGHQVRGLALSYRHRSNSVPSLTRTGGVHWETMNALPFSPISAIRHLTRLRKICAEFRPDIVWASSDAWHGIALQAICHSLKIPCVIDLYDNYESFGLSSAPGVIPLFRRACRLAEGLTAVSRTLVAYLKSDYALPTGHPVFCLGNAVDTQLFRPIDQSTARQQLGLPVRGTLIGTAGALDASRGIATLLEAYSRLIKTTPSVRLVLAGPRDNTLQDFDNLPILDLGIMPPDRTPLFWNALDVAIISNKDSPFGKYCYPQKLQEIIACQTPLVATNIGEVNEILRDFPQSLAELDSPNSLAEQITRQIQTKSVIPQRHIRSWGQRAEELSSFLSQILKQGRGQHRLALQR
ncbi:MAG: glycosyltransferase [Rhodocyclales bacterium GT-UBC]|nr:MAG: glycosyltransferase [Rhodocyclales bacterium GT-UBC]